MEKFETGKEGKIWAIGGGKGGTGKTFITSSIGTYLAGKGKRVILIDADIGGANLHSFFGIKRPKKSLTNFFEKRSTLEELKVRTGVGNLFLITGDIYSLASDNIRFTQKLRLFRHIMKLNFQHVLMDLGAGSHNNTLDTFLIADQMIVILEPEILAVENLYHFIKNALFRKLRMALSAYGIREIIEHMWEKRERYNIKNFRDLIDSLKEFSFLRRILDKELSDFKIYLILNKVRSSRDILIGPSVKSIFMKYFGINTQFVGFIEYDDLIRRSIHEKQPFILKYSSSRCADEIMISTENLLQEKEITLPIGHYA